MNYKELPISKIVGSSHDPTELEEYVREALRPSGIVMHFSIVHGLQRSCRIFGRGIFGDAIRMPEVWNAIEIVQQLVSFGTEARYADEPIPGSQKGWEIRRCMINEQPALIALALWV